jgi:hypothetical protein
VRQTGTEEFKPELSMSIDPSGIVLKRNIAISARVTITGKSAYR